MTADLLPFPRGRQKQRPTERFIAFDAPCGIFDGSYGPIVVRGPEVLCRLLRTLVDAVEKKARHDGGISARDLHALQAFAGNILSYRAYGRPLPDPS